MTSTPRSRKKKELPSLNVTATDIALARAVPDTEVFNAARGLRMAFWFIEKCPSIEIAKLLFDAAADTTIKLNKFMATPQQNDANTETTN